MVDFLFGILYNTGIKLGGKDMKSVKISLGLAESVKKFVNVVNKYPYEIDLRSGRFLIDAKSLLGIFSLDLSKPVVMEVHDDNCDDLIEDLKEYVVD